MAEAMNDNLGGGGRGHHVPPSQIRRRAHGPARPRLVEIGDPVTAAPAAAASTPPEVMERGDHHRHDGARRKPPAAGTGTGKADEPADAHVRPAARHRTRTRLVVGGGAGDGDRDRDDEPGGASGNGGRRGDHGKADRRGRRDGDDGGIGSGDGGVSSLARAAGAGGGPRGTTSLSSNHKRKKTGTSTSTHLRLVVGGEGGSRSADGDNDTSSPSGATAAASVSREVSRAQSLGESSGDFGRWSSFGNGSNNGNGFDGGGFAQGGNDAAGREDGDDGDGVVAMEEVEEEYPAEPSSNFAALSSHHDDVPHPAVRGAAGLGLGWAGGVATTGGPAAPPPSAAIAQGTGAVGNSDGFAPPHHFHPPPDPHHPHSAVNNGYDHHPSAHVGHQQHHQRHTHHCHPEAHHPASVSVSTSLAAAHETLYPETSSPTASQLDEIIRMDVDAGPLPPLIVMDGANVAHSYASVRRHNSSPPFPPAPGASSLETGRRHKHEPDARGIAVAAEYFLSSGCRVVAVVPAHWLTVRPRPGDEDQGNAMMKTPQLEALSDLKSRGILCCAPPTDDDDAYILAIARRADARARSRGDFNGLTGAFVLSCDLFRDAVAREHRLHRQYHQQHPDGEATAATTGLRKWLNGGPKSPPGRISFTFCDTGVGSDHWGEEADAELDFVPNPRHPLIAELEQKRLMSDSNG